MHFQKGLPTPIYLIVINIGVIFAIPSAVVNRREYCTFMNFHRWLVAAKRTTRITSRYLVGQRGVCVVRNHMLASVDVRNPQQYSAQPLSPRPTKDISGYKWNFRLITGSFVAVGDYRADGLKWVNFTFSACFSKSVMLTVRNIERKTSIGNRSVLIWSGKIRGVARFMFWAV